MTERQERLIKILQNRRVMLTEGAIVERIRRDPEVELDPHVANAGLIYSERGREALSTIWREYIDVACDTGHSILLSLPTWRANPERLATAGLPDVQRYTQDAYVFLDRIRSSYGSFSDRIFISGLIGCKGDAYRPEEALTIEQAENFHRPQIEALADTDVDLLLAVTLPALSEAVGIAKEMAQTSVPYGASFVLRPEGTLLDGTPLEEAVAQMDASVRRPPLGYYANCVHPAHFYAALRSADQRRPLVHERFVGIQGNASQKTPEELDGSGTIDADNPNDFALAMARLNREFGISLLGGCCGTDARYIQAITDQLR